MGSTLLFHHPHLLRSGTTTCLGRTLILCGQAGCQFVISSQFIPEEFGSHFLLTHQDSQTPHSTQAPLNCYLLNHILVWRKENQEEFSFLEKQLENFSVQPHMIDNLSLLCAVSRPHNRNLCWRRGVTAFLGGILYCNMKACRANILVTHKLNSSMVLYLSHTAQ